MFSKVLVANRGEIAIRAFRAAYELGARTVAVFPNEDRWSEHRLKADEAYEIGERGHPVRAYLDPDAIVAVAVRAGADAVYPGYGFLSENPRLAEACANAGITFVGPTADVLTPDRQQGARDRGGQGGRRTHPRLGPAERRRRRDRRGGERAAVPALRQGRRRRRRAGHAAASTRPEQLREAVETCMREAEGAFGDPTVFVEQAVVDPRHIEVQILADGAGERDPPLRARLLRPATAPEGRRDRAGAAPRPGPPDEDVRGRGEVRAAHRLPQRRHRRVPPGPRRQLRLHRDEPAHPGRAHRDRGGHRRRPRPVADADRVRRDARGPRPEPGQHRAAGCGAPVPDHDRGPGQQLPARHRTDHDVPLPRRRRHPPRRRHDLHRRRDQPALRLDAGEADVPRPHLREGRRAREAGAGGVPDPRCLHQHRLPAGPARRPGLPGRPRDDVVHRDAPRPADRTLVG